MAGFKTRAAGPIQFGRERGQPGPFLRRIGAGDGHPLRLFDRQATHGGVRRIDVADDAGVRIGDRDADRGVLERVGPDLHFVGNASPFFEDGLPLMARFQSVAQAFLFSQIAHRGNGQGLVIDHDGADLDVHREFGAVAAECHQVQFGAHPARARIDDIGCVVCDMQSAQRPRQQILDEGTDQHVSPQPEHLAGATVDVPDAAVVTDDQNSVGAGFERGGQRGIERRQLFVDPAQAFDRRAHGTDHQDVGRGDEQEREMGIGLPHAFETEAQRGWQNEKPGA